MTPEDAAADAVRRLGGLICYFCRAFMAADGNTPRLVVDGEKWGMCSACARAQMINGSVVLRPRAEGRAASIAGMIVPYVAATRSSAGAVLVPKCPYCAKPHDHGRDLGRREAPCGQGPYVLVLSLGAGEKDPTPTSPETPRAKKGRRA